MPKAKERTDLASGLGVKNPGKAGMVVENPAGLENHPSAKRCHRLRGGFDGRPTHVHAAAIPVGPARDAARRGAGRGAEPAFELSLSGLWSKPIVCGETVFAGQGINRDLGNWTSPVRRLSSGSF